MIVVSTKRAQRSGYLSYLQSCLNNSDTKSCMSNCDFSALDDTTVNVASKIQTFVLDQPYVLERKSQLFLVERYLNDIPDIENFKLPTPLYPISLHTILDHSAIHKFEYICTRNRICLPSWPKLFQPLNVDELRVLIELANYLDCPVLVHNASCYLKLLLQSSATIDAN